MLWAGLVFAITLVAYLPAMRNGYVWDDRQNVTDNRLLRTVEGLKQTWVDPSASFQYYPLTYTGFWIEYHLWGLHPLGYHLVNVLLHALNAILLGTLLTRLSVPGAWLAALIFAVHPVHVESVAWVTELKNVLSGLFFLSAFLAYWSYRQRTEYRRMFYALALFLFLLALLGKTSTVSLPIVILAVLWWKQGRVTRRDFLLVIPFILLALPMGLLTTWVERHYVGAEGAGWQLSLVDRLLVAGRVVWFYAGKLLWPHPLMFVYPRWEVNGSVWWQYLFPVAAIAVLLFLWCFRQRLGKAPFVAMLFYAGMVAPVPAFFNLWFMRYSYVADHFPYLASMGFIALVAAVFTVALRDRAARIATTIPALAVLGALSWQHCGVFRDDETLWRDTIAKNPACWMAYNNLGALLFDAGKTQEAIGYYEQALRVKPDHAEASYNLGNAYWQQGKRHKAMECYAKALQSSPKNAAAHYNLANALADAGQLQEAVVHYETALQIDPRAPPAHNNLANVLVQMGKLDEAISHYEKALQLKKDFADPHNNLAAVLLSQGRVNEAMAHRAEALRIRPDNAAGQYDVGVIFATQGKINDAIAHFKEAIRLKPDYGKACNNLAWLLATNANSPASDQTQAVQLAERACQLVGEKQAPYLDTLAAAYAATDRFQEAVATAEEALALARATGLTRLASEIEARVQMYRAGRPYHEPVAPENQPNR